MSKSSHRKLLFKRLVTRHGDLFSRIRRNALTLLPRRELQYDRAAFTERISIVGSRRTKSRGTTKHKRQRLYICIHTVGRGGTKACIESRNANASNIDTASPFERSLNLSRHSSHPFYPRLDDDDDESPNTALYARTRDSPRVFSRRSEKRYTRASRTNGWSRRTPQSIGCAGFSMTINDQIRETLVRVNVRVLLATSPCHRRACACVHVCVCVYVRIQ